MSEAAPAAEGEVEKKRRLLRRVPTSLVVTLVGIALSAWLFPALTRQWDDRKRARELQALVAEDITSASARVLTTGRDSLFHTAFSRTGRSLPRQLGLVPLSDSERGWSIATLQIEAKLRAYFPNHTLASWRGYSDFMIETLSIASGRVVGIAASVPDLAITPPGKLPGAWYERLSEAERSLVKAQVRFRVAYDAHPDMTSLQLPAVRLLRAYNNVAGQLLAVEEQIASDVLASHPRGYTTSAHDFFHDLIP
jgi:hypothetical protein